MFGFYFAKGDQEGWLAGAKGRKLRPPGIGLRQSYNPLSTIRQIWGAVSSWA